MTAAAGAGATQRGSERPHEREFWKGVARALGGAMVFALPMLMTMEMWWLGFYIDRFRLVLLMVLNFPALVLLSHFLGFKQTITWMDDVADALVAYGVGLLGSALVLLLLGLVGPGMSIEEVVGKIAIQTVSTSLGAMLARSQLSGGQRSGRGGAGKREPGYTGEVFLMLVGAVFLAYNLAPTQEMIVIAFRIDGLLSLTLIAVSLVAMHGFVYALSFERQVPAEDDRWWSLFLRFTCVGYALALIASAYMLWTFGRLEGTSLTVFAKEMVVLGFPASLGAAGARLMLGPPGRNS